MTGIYALQTKEMAQSEPWPAGRLANPTLASDSTSLQMPPRFGDVLAQGAEVQRLDKEDDKTSSYLPSWPLEAPAAMTQSLNPGVCSHLMPWSVSYPSVHVGATL